MYDLICNVITCSVWSCDTGCYDCVFICLDDCLAYLLCIVYFRDIN